MEVFVVIIVQWFSIKQDLPLPLLRFIQPLQETDTGSLSTSRGTHQGRHLPWLQFHTH